MQTQPNLIEPSYSHTPLACGAAASDPGLLGLTQASHLLERLQVVDQVVQAVQALLHREVKLVMLGAQEVRNLHDGLSCCCACGHHLPVAVQGDARNSKLGRQCQQAGVLCSQSAIKGALCLYMLMDTFCKDLTCRAASRSGEPSMPTLNVCRACWLSYAFLASGKCLRAGSASVKLVSNVAVRRSCSHHYGGSNHVQRGSI